jgi:pyruvate dehydrogenase E2 component (dihydrolipoamide acetyltransferase)
MATVVRMPALAAGATEGAIQTWLVEVGDTVAQGQPIVEIETEKAIVEYEAEEEGVVAEILVAEGSAAAVGAPIAVLTTDASDAPTPAPSAPVANTEGSEDGVDGAPPPVADVEDDPDPVPPAPRDRVFASPLVRRLAKERGIDLSTVRGSGPQGRIVRRDLDSLPTPSTSVSDAPAASAPSAEASGYRDEPHTPMRRAIARRLTESATTVPHFFLTADCRVDELLALRTRINERTGSKVSVNDFVLMGVAAAMADVPRANAIWMPDAIRRFETVDIGVAVSIPGGLVTPVLRDAGSKSLGEVSAAVRDLASRARDGKLKQHEIEGGSFAVSNLGMYGTKEFTAIINPPHAGILAVGAATRRPVVDGGELAVGSVMTVTLSADHRVMDGALAAEWLAAFVAHIENPLGLLL